MSRLLMSLIPTDGCDTNAYPEEKKKKKRRSKIKLNFSFKLEYETFFSTMIIFSLLFYFLRFIEILSTDLKEFLELPEPLNVLGVNRRSV